jgi:hypothetical protein
VTVIQGKQSAAVYRKRLHGVSGSTHSDGAIKSNWQNAIKRSVAKKSIMTSSALHLSQVLGIPRLRPTLLTDAIPTMHSGGSLDQRVLIKNFNLTVYHLLFFVLNLLALTLEGFMSCSQQLILNLVGFSAQPNPGHAHT